MIKRSAAVIGVDDTLFRAAPRTQRILGEWAKTPAGQPFAKGIAKLKQADIGYEMAAVSEKAGIPKALHAEVGKFHIDRFFANEYLKFDRVFPFVPAGLVGRGIAGKVIAS